MYAHIYTHIEIVARGSTMNSSSPLLNPLTQGFPQQLF